LSIFETSIDDAGPPLHVHDREDEGFYVLDGDLSVRCGGDVFDAPRGSLVFQPRYSCASDSSTWRVMR
jgi:mannose-6-phosphate isomerase-like protein (cupin superfamily)